MRKIILFSVGLILMISIDVVAASPTRALTIDDLLACKRLSEPSFSPDGRWIAFTVKTMDEADNRSRSTIWLINPQGDQLHKAIDMENSCWAPRWSPDGNKLAFLSSKRDRTQLWIKDMKNDRITQVTTHHTGVEDYCWSPLGNKIAFTSRVYPDCPDQECNRERDLAKKENPVKARVYRNLLYRHWDKWWDHKRSHLFVLDLEADTMIDVTPGDYDIPPIALAQGFTFSPDGKALYFTSNHAEMIAVGTNNDIWSVPVEGGPLRLVTVKTRWRDFKGNDSAPAFSPDGKYLSFLSMERAGFEADKPDLMLKNVKTGKIINLTGRLDIRIVDYQWLPDSKGLLLRVDDEGRYRIKHLDLVRKKIFSLIEEGYSSSLSVAPDGKSFVYLHQNSTRPFELFRWDLPSGQSQQLTHFNEELLADVDMNPVEDFWFEGTDQRRIHGFLVKPPFFNPQRKYPLVYLIHGGPQGAWHDGWHYRWNVQLWAAQGYAVALVNPRGSTGYGQEFTDEITKDWGGKVFQDLVAGQQYVIENYGFIDSVNMAAAGASYGGYMINWIEGHMEAFRYPFRTLVNHDGAFNLYSMYLTTEELWFPEWEFGGPFWEDDTYYRRWSPHLFIENFATPMLIIHGQDDYRLDYGEALMVFTALRRRNVPAKLVLFPDEGHFVLKPQNSRFWHQTIFNWLAAYLQ